jgi:cyanophycinase
MNRKLLSRILRALLAGAPLALAAQEPTRWWPERGAVVLAGGGLQQRTADKFVDSLIALAGGPDANIVIIPTAFDGLPSRLPGVAAEPKNVAAVRAQFASRGAKRVTFLHTSDRRVANSEAFVAPLKTAKVVFITGGRSRIVDETYHGTLVERELKAVLARGGVLGGDSAGAIALGCLWLGWKTNDGPFGIVTEGMCTMPGVTVSPHMSDAPRMAPWLDSIAVYVQTHPSIVPVNVWENTFVIIHDGKANVVGAGKAMIGREKLAAGQVLDLSALPAQAPTGARCDSIQYRFVDDAAPTTARRYRNAETGQSYTLRDSIVLDGHGIAQIEVRPRRNGADTTWDLMARLTPTATSALTAATASHVGSTIAVLVGDEVVQTAIIQSALRTTVLPIRTDLSRHVADSLALRARRVGGGCTAPSSLPP